MRLSKGSILINLLTFVLLVTLLGGLYLLYKSHQTPNQRTLPPIQVSPTITPNTTLTPNSQAPQSPVTAKLDVLSAGKLGEVAQLQLTIVSEVDAPTADVMFQLPQGVTLTAGDKEIHTSLRKNESKQFTITIRLDSAGEKQVVGQAILYLYGGRVGNGDVVFLEVSPTGTTVQRVPQNSGFDGTLQQTTPVP